MDVGIFGAGAIGGYLGIRLSAAGVPVRLVGRPELLAQAGSLVAVDLAGRETRPGPGLSAPPKRRRSPARASSSSR